MFALVARMVPAERVGAVTGVVGAAGGLGGFFPPLVMGLVYRALGGCVLGFLLLAAAAAGAFTATIVNAQPPRPAEQIRTEAGMEKISLTALARHHLDAAARASAGRSAHTVFGGHEHVLRQTVIALLAGRELAEHENPGEATVHVLRGRVRLVAGEDSWEGRQGDLLVVPRRPHALAAEEDAVVLLTVAKHGHQRR